MNQPRNHRNTRRAFTLIELLVVVAVIAILISVLLPALNAARGAAQKIGGATRHKSMGVAQFAYASENDNDFAGPNTSGARYLSNDLFDTGLVNGWEALEFNTSADTPTSTYDWISPTLGQSLNFSPNRAERTADIFNNWACPAASRPNDILYDDSVARDQADFERVILNEGFNQISFLGTLPFMERGRVAAQAPLPGEDPNALLNRGSWIRNSLREENGGISIPDNHIPRFDKVKNASNKIMITDGNRYLVGPPTESVLLLDFDFTVNPRRFGSFTTDGPIFTGSTAFGRTNNPSGGQQIPLTFRHDGNRGINTTRFDGSVQSMNFEEVYTDPTPWLPTGTRWSNSSAPQEMRDFMANDRDGIIN